MHSKTYSLVIPIIEFFVFDATSARSNLLLAHEAMRRHRSTAEKLVGENGLPIAGEVIRAALQS
jgi:hypothetical protein